MKDQMTAVLHDAANNLSVASSILGQLGDLFAGIKALAKANPGGCAFIAGMADLGQLVAEDWANTVDVQGEEFSEKAEAIKAVRP